MRIFLAGEHTVKNGKGSNWNNLYILETYMYISKNKRALANLKDKKYKALLLDSGAFTFMNSNKSETNWDEYVERYGNFIKDNGIKYFFELDIDSIVGIIEVERLRNKLEKIVGRKCIPVWHKSRGKQYWIDMVKNYNYVAIGGIVTKEITQKEYPIFTYLIKEARKQNCNVHGLGFTNLKGLEKYKFYSVDSTSWLSGNRFGAIYWFNGKTMEKVNKKPGQRVKTNECAINNFNEWVKFQKYAEVKL